MPRASADKPYTNFSRGLVTEATDLNYPENSVRDIQNMDIDANGSARRRLGIELENNPFALQSSADGSIRDLPFSAHVWQSPGGDSTLTFVVFCSGLKFYVRNLDAESLGTLAYTVPFTSNTAFNVPSQNFFDPRNFIFIPRKNYVNGEIDGTAQAAWEEEAKFAEFQSATGDGKIFFTSKYHRPFFMVYDPLTKVITMSPVGVTDQNPLGALLVRDFAGIPEPTATGSKQADLTQVHGYNLVNQGWSASQINAFKSSTGVYPANSQQWILGKDPEDVFSPALLNKQDFGNSPAPKGGVIYDVLDGVRDIIPYTRNNDVKSFRKYYFDLIPILQPFRTLAGYKTYLSSLGGEDVTTVNGSIKYALGVFNDVPVAGETGKVIDLKGAANVIPDASFTTCAFFAGRVWFSGDVNQYNPNGVYFSKTIQTDGDTGIFMQVNDPVSEHFTDLLDTDGGVAYINEAGGILKLVPFGAGMLVFARKGVWFIRGSDSGFKATDFSVDKVSDVGVENPEAVVRIDEGVVFWTENSIMGISSPVEPKIENLSDGVIFNFYQRIQSRDKLTARGIYDSASKRVSWFYWDEEAGDTRFNTKNAYNAALLWDARTGAFSRHSYRTFNNAANDCVVILGAVPRKKPIVKYRQTMVTVGGETVTVGAEDVTTNEPTLLFANERYINTLKPIVGIGAVDGFAVTQYSNTLGVDYGNFGAALAPADLTFDSYLVTPPETLGDLQRNKQAVYLHNFFNRTERYFYEDGGGVIELDRPSACTVTPIWDWQLSDAGGRYGTPQRAYRFKKPVVALADGEVFDNGEGVVYTKLKIRGKGRSLSIRYDSVDNTDFQLLGNSVQYSANGV